RYLQLLEPVAETTHAATTESSATSSSSSSELTTPEAVLEKSEEIATIEFSMETTPKVVEKQPDETVNPTSTHADGQTTVVPVQGGFIGEDDTGHVTIQLPDEEEEEMKPVEMTTSSAETSEAQDKEATHEESKGEIPMDVNEVTTPAPTEPVIVVEDTPSDIDENRVEPGTKQEVKSNSAATFVLSSLSAAVAALLLL
ncbi:hypothetical protein COOONC_26764, partial [Cooperia oncophora]